VNAVQVAPSSAWAGGANALKVSAAAQVSTKAGVSRFIVPPECVPPQDQATLRNFVQVSRVAGDAVVDTAPSGAELVEHEDGLVSTTVVRTGDSIQALVLLPDHDAPSSVTFEVQGQLSQDEEGVITAVMPDGTRWIAAPAWAEDAAGRSVPTRYEIENGKIVQVVDHKSASFIYPIVADPYLGYRLFYRVTRDRYRNDYRYNAWPTPWGAYVSTGPIGYYVTRKYVPCPGCLARYHRRHCDPTVESRAVQGQPVELVEGSHQPPLQLVRR